LFYNRIDYTKPVFNMQAQQAVMEEQLSPVSPETPDTARSAYIQEMNEEYSEDELVLAETTTNNQI